MKRRTHSEELEDAEREKRRKTTEEIQPSPIEFPVHQSVENSAPKNPLASLLDRSGGLAKEKCIRPFCELMSNERRLKHRIALLTVLQLTVSELIPELLKQGLLVTLHDWMEEAIAVGTPPCLQFMKAILNTLISMKLPIFKDCPGLTQWTGGLIEKLQDQELMDLGQQLLTQWTKKSENEDEESKSVTTESVMSKRVEGLNSPIPKASFRKTKVQLPSVEKVKISIRTKLPPSRHTSKRVRWASDSELVQIRTFHESDPPDQLLVSPSPVVVRQSMEAKSITPRLKWTTPIPWKLTEDWNVKSGEESEEKQVQIGRDERVVAFDVQSGRTVCTSGNPEEPFFNDSYPNPFHIIPTQYL
eukprot:g7576.t1